MYIFSWENSKEIKKFTKELKKRLEEEFSRAGATFTFGKRRFGNKSYECFGCVLNKETQKQANFSVLYVGDDSGDPYSSSTITTDKKYSCAITDLAKKALELTA